MEYGKIKKRKPEIDVKKTANISKVNKVWLTRDGQGRKIWTDSRQDHLLEDEKTCIWLPTLLFTNSWANHIDFLEPSLNSVILT